MKVNAKIIMNTMNMRAKYKILNSVNHKICIKQKSKLIAKELY